MKALSIIQIRWFVRFLLPLLLALPATSGGSALAQDPELAGEWEISLEVRNSQIFATWVGRVWHYTDGVGEITATRRVNISNDCQLFGGVVVGKSDLTFDGVDDYVTCTIPNFSEIFAEMAPELLNCRCDFAGPPYAAADVSPVLSETAQPVIFHNRLSLDVMQVDTQSLRIPFLRGEGVASSSEVVNTPVATDFGVANLNLRFKDEQVLLWQSWQSNIFAPAQEDGIQLWAGFDATHFTSYAIKEAWPKFLADRGFWEAVQPQHDNGFLMWESEGIAKYTTEEMPGNFSLPRFTDIHIGHNPDDNTFFEGTIRTVAVDPGCRAH